AGLVARPRPARLHERLSIPEALGRTGACLDGGPRYGPPEPPKRSSPPGEPGARLPRPPCPYGAAPPRRGPPRSAARRGRAPPAAGTTPRGTTDERPPPATHAQQPPARRPGPASPAGPWPAAPSAPCAWRGRSRRAAGARRGRWRREADPTCLDQGQSTCHAG